MTRKGERDFKMDMTVYAERSTVVNRLLLKIILICTLAFIVAVSSCCLVFAEGDVVAEGSCGENVTWVLTGETGDMTLTISGTGEMDNLSSTAQPWSDYKNDIVSVVIEDGVTTVGSYAFYQYSGITGADMPESVASIGTSAFEYCRNLSSVSLHEGLNSIGAFAFGSCAITDLVIPNSVTSLGNQSFSISTLKNVSMPIDVAVYFDKNAFLKCSDLNVTVTSGEVVTENSGFYNNSKIASVTLPKGVTKIGPSAFYSCDNLKEVYLPNSVTEISNLAFSRCPVLEHVDIKKGVRTIGASAFSSCSNLERIDLPDTVLSMGEYAFNSCSKLKSIHIPVKLTIIEPYTFAGCKSIKKVEIPVSVKSIGANSFSGCSSLSSITIPDSVDQIAPNAISDSDILYIYCEKGSVAEQYAIDGNFKYDLTTGHKYEEENIIDEQDATCTEDGVLLFYCPTCRRNIEKVIPASHDWGDPSYIWSEDNKTVTATRICKKDNDHKETVTVNTTAEVTKKATYTSKGQTTYTATFNEDAFETQSKTVTDIPQLSKKANTLSVKTKTNTLKYNNLKKKNQVIAAKKAFIVSKAQGKVTYKKASGNKNFIVNSAGKITVRKGLKKGTYKVKVKVTAAGNTIYKAGAKTVTLAIRIN